VLFLVLSSSEFASGTFIPRAWVNESPGKWNVQDRTYHYRGRLKVPGLASPANGSVFAAIMARRLYYQYWFVFS
jgi:hypothetical protein